MALPTPPPYSNSIPNNPFYYPFEWYICGPYSPFIVGSGLYVDNDTAYISSTGGGGGAVTGVFAGTGIGVNANTGNVTVTNNGVTSLTAGPGINLSGGTGSVTITNTKNGTVTAITAGTGLTGGIITASGTIALANTAVTPGLYTNATLTVDAQGRITNAVSNTALSSLSVNPPLTSTGGANPVLGITAASTTACGAVQLSDSVTSNSSTTAATSLALKTAYDIAIAAIPKSCITAQGTLITGVGPSTPVALPVGTNGQILVACSSCIEGMYWASTTLPPFGSPNYGSFFDITPSVSLTTPGTGQPVNLGSTVSANGISILNGSEIHFSVAGVYNIQYSLQFEDSNASSDIIEVWVAKNGTALANSNSKITSQGAGKASLLAVNIVDSFLATDYIQIYWGTLASSVTLSTLPSGLLNGPVSPNAIVTVTPVGA